MRSLVKIMFVFLFLSLLIVKPTPSYAWHGRTYVGVNLGVWPGGYYYGGPYYGYPYYADPYYYPGYVVAAPQASYQPVVINGTTYYVNNGVYYLYTAYGYQAVTPPAQVSQPVMVSGPAVAAPASAEDTITVNVPNDKGGYTAVVLRPSGKGFVGPQGEFYPEFPKVSQLKTMYGK